MADPQYDAIVVGARCAGAATARLLAQKGHRTLLLDRDTFPSDMPMSTHLIWQAGASLLQRWGLLDAVRASGCPPLRSGTLDLGAFALTGSPPSDLAEDAYAPRRFVLDAILVNAAVAEGAELREGFVVGDVLWKDGQVVGVVGGSRGAAREELSARLVIGADGRNSRIAQAVSAPSYNEIPAVAGTRFAYYSGVEVGLEFTAGERRMVFAWPTNDEQALVGFMLPRHEFLAMRDDVEGHATAELQKWAPNLHERVRRGTRESAWQGGSVESFCRRPFGPGWALVGDAGMTMDPITAAGITNALRDADLLSNAADAGLSGARPLDEALAEHGARRDAAALPMYHFTHQMAQFAPTPPEMLAVFDALRDNREDTDRYFGVFAQTVPVGEFFNPENLQRIVAQGSDPSRGSGSAARSGVSKPSPR
jgi:flavin-dependent dehydrogenase